MPVFEIEQYELHSTTFRVDAESEAQAIQKLFDGEAQAIDNSQVYIEVADDFGLPVDEFRAIARELRALGVPIGDDIIPAIRSVCRVDYNATGRAEQE